MIRFISPPFCVCCGLPFQTGEDHFCGDCLQGRFVFDQARAAVIYAEPVVAPLLAFKYQGDLSGLEVFASLAHPLLVCPAHLYAHCDLIVPVPLHPRRLRGRGFNQALLLAQCFFPHYRARIYPELLARIRHTAPQSGQSGRARRRNLRGAFMVTTPSAVKGKSILLVDDVLTTGTTVNECAAVLRTAGATEIQVFTLARTV